MIDFFNAASNNSHAFVLRAHGSLLCLEFADDGEHFAIYAHWRFGTCPLAFFAPLLRRHTNLGLFAIAFRRLASKF